MNIQMIVFLYQFIHQEAFLKVSNLYACSIYYVEQCLGLNGRMNKKNFKAPDLKNLYYYSSGLLEIIIKQNKGKNTRRT